MVAWDVNWTTWYTYEEEEGVNTRWSSFHLIYSIPHVPISPDHAPSVRVNTPGVAYSLSLSSYLPLWIPWLSNYREFKVPRHIMEEESKSAERWLTKGAGVEEQVSVPCICVFNLVNLCPNHHVDSQIGHYANLWHSTEFMVVTWRC